MGTCFKVADDNDDVRIRTITIIFYVILGLTSVRYKQFITGQRCCSAFLIVAGYIAYWICMAIFILNFQNGYVYLMIGCSVITAICDTCVFTSYFYKDDEKMYDVLPGS